MSAARARNYDFSLNPRLTVRTRRIGREGEPVVMINDLLQHPRQLIEYAATEVAFAPVFGPDGGYPGVRAPAPLDYVETVARALSPTIEQAFGLTGVALAAAECSFSLVTLPPERLAPLQRVPHTDTDDPLQFALLHYLCDASHGGTAFYRHRDTGFETLTAARRATYEGRRNRELETVGPAYITGDSPQFEQIAEVGAAFNRLVVYRSRLLHSGQIREPGRLSADPRTGRLTANIFLNYRQGRA